MSTHFSGEGNIGSAPEFHEYHNGNEEPRRVLRLSAQYHIWAFMIVGQHPFYRYTLDLRVSYIASLQLPRMFPTN